MSAKTQFFGLIIDMSWQLAITVIVPILLGVYAGKKVGAEVALTIVGLVVALILSTLVMVRVYKKANSLPVPKLTEKERAAVKKSYEEDDD